MDENPDFFTEAHNQDGHMPCKGRVLAVRGGALGDFILTLPALRVLRVAGYEVELLTRPAYGRLAQDAGIVSGWRAVDSPPAAAVQMAGAGIDPGWREWLSGFDVVVSWLPDADGAFQQQVRSCGVRAFHQGDWRCAGPGPAAWQLGQAIAFTGAAIAPVTDLFAATSLDHPGGGNVIAVHPGSGSPRKNWPFARWLTVMKQLESRDPGLSWLVITGEAEVERLGEISSGMDRCGLRWEWAHDLSLSVLARHRLRPCRMLLGHDSGIGHLSAACGVPCRLLFGATDPAVWAPPGDHIRVIQAPGGRPGELTACTVLDWLTPDFR